MLPELEGIFSGLIRIIFMRPIELINIGDYSETEIRQLIKEINVIYQHFNLEYGEQEATKKALIHFVNEINRRFGVITRTEWEKFQRIVQEARTMNDFGMMNQTNYSILPDEDGYTQSSQLLPPIGLLVLQPSLPQVAPGTIQYRLCGCPNRNAAAQLPVGFGTKI